MRDEGVFGLRFVYKKHRLNHSRIIDKNGMEKIDASCANSDLMYVFCGECRAYMIYEGGYYICRSCGTKMKETTAFRKLEKENESWLERLEEDVPEGCTVCGGPYPDCMTGCKLCN